MEFILSFAGIILSLVIYGLAWRPVKRLICAIVSFDTSRYNFIINSNNKIESLVQNNYEELPKEIKEYIEATHELIGSRELSQRLYKTDEDFALDLLKGNITITQLLFGNFGNTPIIPIDFIRPICITFNRKVVTLSAKITDKSSDNLDIDIESGKDNILMKPMLLNEGDSFKLTILIKNSNQEQNIEERHLTVNINARIAGIKEIEKAYSTSKLFLFILRDNLGRIGVVLGIGSVALIIGFQYRMIHSMLFIGAINLNIGLILGILFSFVWVIIKPKLGLNFQIFEFMRFNNLFKMKRK